MELLVRVLACVVEDADLRAAARVFEIDPNTVRSCMPNVRLIHI
jgi:hypothetical protein